MSFKFPQKRKPLWIALFLCLILILGISIGYLTNHVFSENAKFEAFAEKVFEKEVSGSTLTLHYSLAHPEEQGIKRPEPTLGTVTLNTEETNRQCKEYEDTLREFSYSKLSRDNQITLDLMLLYFHTQGALGEEQLLEEVFSPSLGIQAQLPVLLAEYAFYEDQDIADYLKLLSSIRPYFQSLLAFEQKKSEAGCFMSDTTLQRILQQCNAFIKNPDSNYMLEIFSQKLSDYGKFTDEEQKKLNAQHKKLLTEQVIPAYQELMAGLSNLRGTGKDSRGLAHFEGGQRYYLYLLQSQVGTYVPVKKIEERLSRQLMADYKEISLMLREQPSLLTKLTGGADLPALSADEMIAVLQEQMAEDFPALESVPYEIRYVHESMEEYLSPAFYLTPPLDTGNPNVIYINRSGQSKNLELFTTLAHESFPGHLYQTVSFGRQNPGHIRYLINSSGYVEGWATYIESYAYQYAASLLDDPAAADITHLAWLNRSVNLCIYSLLDIGIHYRGWDLKKVSGFLKTFGIQSSSAAQDIFQYIVETPANYLKYYWGYLNFLDLKTSLQKQLGESFDLKEFHEMVLDIGPVPFPILKKYIWQEAGLSKNETLLSAVSHLITPKKLLQLRKSSGKRFGLLMVQILQNGKNHLIVKGLVMQIRPFPFVGKGNQNNSPVFLASGTPDITFFYQIVDSNRQGSHCNGNSFGNS